MIHFVLDIIKLICYIVIFILGIKLMLIAHEMKRKNK